MAEFKISERKKNELEKARAAMRCASYIYMMLRMFLKVLMRMNPQKPYQIKESSTIPGSNGEMVW